MFLPSLGFCMVTHSLSITYNNVGCEVASFMSGIREIKIDLEKSFKKIWRIKIKCYIKYNGKPPVWTGLRVPFLLVRQHKKKCAHPSGKRKSNV